MYDFNPLATLFLVKALPVDVPTPTLGTYLRRLLSKLARAPKFRKSAVTANKTRERAYSFPVHASYPSYNVHTRSEAPAR